MSSPSFTSTPIGPLLWRAKANQFLRNAETEILCQVTADAQSDYLKLVIFGMQIALHGGCNGIWASLERSRDPIHDCVATSINLALLVQDLGEFDFETLATRLAAKMLMVEALDFVLKAGICPIDADALTRANGLFAQIFSESLRVSRDRGVQKAGVHHELN